MQYEDLPSNYEDYWMNDYKGFVKRQGRLNSDRLNWLRVLNTKYFHPLRRHSLPHHGTEGITRPKDVFKKPKLYRQMYKDKLGRMRFFNFSLDSLMRIS